jgi:hypothetical protein
MKITIDIKTGEVKVGGKLFNEASEANKNLAETYLRKAIRENTMLSDYEMDSMWMSYRYCIGRHTIASHMRANDIWNNCRNRMSKDRQLFNAYDMNREIEQKMAFRYPCFRFPITNLNRIYTTAVDIVCQFMEDYNINSKEDLLKYRDINVILTDNEQGYKLETTTWEEHLRSKVIPFLRKYYKIEILRNEESLWNRFVSWRNKEDVKFDKEITDYFEEITKDIPNPENYYMHDFEDLFVWNDLVHCFDYEHHHKSILVDGTECEWFWTWTEKTEKRDDGYYYKAFGYKKIRVPVDKWNGSYTTWIPDEAIKENLY